MDNIIEDKKLFQNLDPLMDIDIDEMVIKNDVSIHIADKYFITYISNITEFYESHLNV
jgi:hypothetical protein